MRIVETRPPSFPEVELNRLLDVPQGVRWTEICGDGGHWRVGLYSPAQTDAEQVTELERHDCPELFLLISGRVVLVLAEQGLIRELELEAGKPVLVTSPHSAYCPDGPHTGSAFVVERDSFNTEYRLKSDW